MPISLGFWGWGCPKRGDVRITVTAGNWNQAIIELVLDCRENLELVWKKKTLLIAPICPQVSQTTTKTLHSLMRFRCHRKSIHVHATV